MTLTHETLFAQQKSRVSSAGPNVVGQVSYSKEFSILSTVSAYFRISITVSGIITSYCVWLNCDETSNK